MSRLRRVGLENRKIQLLFGEPIPMTGQFFYEIELLSYFPKNKCEFTVGIVDYFEARDHLHSRDSYF